MSRVNWQRTIDQILLTTTNDDDRVIGVTSIRRGAGVSVISRYLAKTLAADRLRVLVLDLSEAKTTTTKATERTAVPVEITEQITSSGNGYDVLLAGEDEPNQDVLVDLPRLRELLQTELADYARVVIDMPPILNEGSGAVNSVAAGANCDQLLLVTRMGRDKRGELTEVLSLLQGAGIRPSALLANEFR